MLIGSNAANTGRGPCAVLGGDLGRVQAVVAADVGHLDVEGVENVADDAALLGLGGRADG